MFLAKAKSLPANPNEASSVYINYLETVFREAGLHLDEVVPAQNAAEVKPASNIPGIKKTGHQTMTFTARAKGGRSAARQRHGANADDAVRAPHQAVDDRSAGHRGKKGS